MEPLFNKKAFDADIDARQNKVSNFMGAVQRANDEISQSSQIRNSVEVKMRKLEEERVRGIDIVLGEILGKLYVDSLPIEQEYKDANYDDLKNGMIEFITNKGGAVYISEAIKRTGSTKLKSILEAAKEIAKDDALKKSESLSQIEYSDLNFRVTDEQNQLIDKISKDVEFDEISEIIKDNVQKVALEEIERAKFEENREQELEESLTQDEAVTSESVLNKKLDFINLRGTKVYHPSLFEAMMMSRAKAVMESGGEGKDLLIEAKKEYTKYELVKTLMLESFSAGQIRDMVYNYTKA